MKQPLLIALCLLIISCTTQSGSKAILVPSTKQNPYAIDLAGVIGGSYSEVETVLGAPSRTQHVNPSSTPCPCLKVYFKGGDIEILFINDKADWITINSPYYTSESSNLKVLFHKKFREYEYIKVTTP